MKRGLIAGFVLVLALPGAHGEPEPWLKVERIEELRAGAAGGYLELKLRVDAARLEKEEGVKVLEYGDVHIEEALDDRKRPLVFSPVQGFRPLQRRDLGDFTGPVSLALRFDPSSRDATKVLHLSGSMKLRIFRQQVVLVERVKTLMNQKIQNPLFEAHGITVRAVSPRQAFPGVQDEELEQLDASALGIEVSGEVDKVRDVQLVDAAGKVLETTGGSFGVGQVLLYGRRCRQALPEEVGLRILIPVSPQDETLRFDFRDIPLP